MASRECGNGRRLSTRNFPRNFWKDLISHLEYFTNQSKSSDWNWNTHNTGHCRCWRSRVKNLGSRRGKAHLMPLPETKNPPKRTAHQQGALSCHTLTLALQYGLILTMSHHSSSCILPHATNVRRPLQHSAPARLILSCLGHSLSTETKQNSEYSTKMSRILSQQNYTCSLAVVTLQQHKICPLNSHALSATSNSDRLLFSKVKFMIMSLVFVEPWSFMKEKGRAADLLSSVEHPRPALQEIPITMFTNCLHNVYSLSLSLRY